MKSILRILSVLLVLLACEKEGDDTTQNKPNNPSNPPQEPSYTDPRDGRVYAYDTIGNQVWMLENLAYAPAEGQYLVYDNDSANLAVYGYLYDWATAQQVAPPGWHVATKAEWQELIDFVGRPDAGGILKATGSIEDGNGLWRRPNASATDDYGFAALPNGYNQSDSTFQALGYEAHWWTASEATDTSKAAHLRIGFNGKSTFWTEETKDYGFGVRCVRDSL